MGRPDTTGCKGVLRKATSLLHRQASSQDLLEIALVHVLADQSSPIILLQLSFV